jgi:predicted ATPase
MITKLRLTNFKNFRQAEIAFGPVSVLVGANATGKSNIRDALRFLHGIARGYNLAEMIGEKYGEGGQLQWSGIRGGTREACFSGESAFGIGVDIEHRTGTSSHAAKYSYEITVQCGANGSAPRVVREGLWRHGELVFDSHPQYDALVQEDPTHLKVRLKTGEQWRSRGSILTGISNQPILTQAIDLAERQKATSKIKTEVTRILEELESVRFIDFSPDLMRKPSTPGQLILSDRGDNLSAVLQAICERPELKLALSNWIQELTPMDVVDFEFEPDAAGKILVYLVEEGQRKTSANSASDGTLRFLGMLAALLGPRPARFYFLEEIDNGIHPARLALLLDMLDNQSRSKGIQIAATTPSPQVLRLIKPENLQFATLAYRLKGSTEGRLRPLPEIPHLMEVVRNVDIARLHESSWMENTMEFSEGSPRSFPIENEAERFGQP